MTEAPAWIDRWHALLGDFTEDTSKRRFTQGRAFQRSGRVGSVRVTPGRLAGQVQGARATPYHVEVQIPPLDDADWAQVVELTATTTQYSARLLAGQLSTELADELAVRGVQLFATRDDLDARCACGDAWRPCAHVIALWDEAAHQFADDPYLFLRLRGRGRSQLMAELGAVRRGADGADPGGVPISELRGAGWSKSRHRLDNITLPAATRPDTSAGPLRLLGDPPGWAGSMSAADLFVPLVVGASDHAQQILDQPIEEGEEGEGGRGAERRAGPA